MKKLFLIDGAMRPAKTEIVKYLDELSKTLCGGKPSKNFLLHKFSTRQIEKGEITDFTTKENLNKEIFEGANNNNYSWISYQYSGHTYAIERKSLENSLNEHENVFLIVRSTELITELKREYEDRVRVIPIYVYSDKKSIEETYAENQNTNIDLEKRKNRLRKADSDYENAMAQASNVYEEVIIYSTKEATGSASIRTKLYGIIKKYDDILEANSVFVVHSYKDCNSAVQLLSTIEKVVKETLQNPMPKIDSLIYGMGSYIIGETVYEAIEKSDYIVCDISVDRCNECEKKIAEMQGVSANIWIELGYSMAVLRERRVVTSKHLAIIKRVTKNSQGIYLPTDVQGYNVIEYIDESDLQKKLQEFFLQSMR